MKLCMDLPKNILLILENKEIQKIDLGRSGSEVYYIKNFGYLKVSDDVPSLTSEKNRCLWLENRLNTPRVLEFGEYSSLDGKSPTRAFLLTTEVKGLPLCDERFLNEPERLIALLSEAMAEFHRVDASDCPFDAEGVEGDCQNPLLCHGDFCLPNIVCDGARLGFVDLGHMGKGDPWLDYAWCLWSLDYNLKTSAYRKQMLKALGVEFDEEKYQKYTAM